MKQVELLQDTVSVILASVAGIQIYTWSESLSTPLFALIMGLYLLITYFIAGVMGIHLYQNWVESQGKARSYQQKGANQNAGNNGTNQPKQG